MNDLVSEYQQVPECHSQGRRREFEVWDRGQWPRACYWGRVKQYQFFIHRQCVLWCLRVHSLFFLCILTSIKAFSDCVGTNKRPSQSQAWKCPGYGHTMSSRPGSEDDVRWYPAWGSNIYHRNGQSQAKHVWQQLPLDEAMWRWQGSLPLWDFKEVTEGRSPSFNRSSINGPIKMRCTPFPMSSEDGEKHPSLNYMCTKYFTYHFP